MPLFRAEAELFTIHSGKKVEQSLAKFQQREMARALKAFLKACLPKIPARTGFVRGAFKPMREAFLRNSSNDLNPGLAALLFGDDKGVAPGTAAKEVFEHLTRYRASPKKDNTADPRNKRQPISASGQEAQRRQYQREVRDSLRRYRKNKTTAKRLKNLRFNEYYYYAKKQRVLKTVPNAVKFVYPQEAGEVLQIKGDVATIQFDVRIIYYRINDNYSRIAGAPWRSMDAGFQAALNYLEVAARKYPYLSEVLVTTKLALRGSQVTKTSGFESSYRGRFGS